MPATLNRVLLLGHLTRDPDLKYMAGKTAVVNAAMAVNDRRKNESGEWIDEPTFVDITVFGRTAEIMNEFLKKGSPVLIEGRLKLDKWETKGERRSRLKVIAERMQMIGNGKKAEQSTEQAEAAEIASASHNDEVPF